MSGRGVNAGNSIGGKALRPWGGVLLVFSLCCGDLSAQPANPFGPAASPSADPFGTSGDPFGTGPATSATGPFAGGAAPAAGPANALTVTTDGGTIRLPANPTDPTVQIYRLRLLNEGRTPAPNEYVEAALILAQIGHPTEGRFYLVKFLQAKIADDEILVRLHRGLTATGLSNLRQRKDLAPEAAEVVAIIEAGTGRYYGDVARMEAWVKQLSDADLAKRREAFTNLRFTGATGISTLFRLWSDSSQKESHAGIRLAARQWPGLGEPLMAAIAADRPGFVAQVLDVLRDHETTGNLLNVALLAVTPSTEPGVREQAELLLRERGETLPRPVDLAKTVQRSIRALRQEASLTRQVKSPYDEPATETIWIWDSVAGTVIAEQILVTSALVRRAAELAAGLTRLVPDDMAAVEAELLTLGDSLPVERPRVVSPEAITAGPSIATDPRTATSPERTRFEALARQLDTPTLGRVFAEAMRDGLDLTAGNLAYLLAERPFDQVMTAGPDRMPPLAAGLRSPSPAVRFATADAIASRPIPIHFSGASLLAEELAFAITGDQTPHVVTCHPKKEQAHSWAATFTTLGFTATGTTTGEDLYRVARSRSDVALLVIDEVVSVPTLTELMSWIRKDERTAHLPVLVLVGPYPGEDVSVGEGGLAFTVVPPGRRAGGPLTAVETELSGDKFIRPVPGRPSPSRMLVTSSAGVTAARPSAEAIEAALPALPTRERSNHPAVRLAITDTRLFAVARAVTADQFQFSVARLTSRGLLSPLTTLSRVGQTEMALDHLLVLARRPDRMFEDDLLRFQGEIVAAADRPESAVLAFTILGEIGSHDAQARLLLSAGQPFRPEWERRVALTAWKQAINDHGLMLTGREIRQLAAGAISDAAPDEVTAELLAYLGSGAAGMTSLASPRRLAP